MNITKLTVGKRLAIGFGAVLLMLMGLMVLAVGALDNARGSIARVFQLTFEGTRLQLITVGTLALLLGIVAVWLITWGLLKQLGCEVSASGQPAGQEANGHPGQTPERSTFGSGSRLIDVG